jgi:hypothetical protein
VTGIGNLRTSSVALVLNTRAVFTDRVIAVFEHTDTTPVLDTMVNAIPVEVVEQ